MLIALTFIAAALATAAALAPPKPILPNDQALNLFNDTVQLIQSNETWTNPQPSVNGSSNIILSAINGTFSPSGLIPFKVKESPTTLWFYDFGPTIPPSELLQTMTAAIAVATRFALTNRGHRNIAKGWFRYQQPFIDGGTVEFAVGDFRENGKPMTYFVLCDILRGMTDFMMRPEYGYREIRFQVEVEGVGSVGSGRVNHTRAAVDVA